MLSTSENLVGFATLSRGVRACGACVERPGSKASCSSRKEAYADYANIGAGMRYCAVCSEHRVETRGYEYSGVQRTTVELSACPLQRMLGYTNTSSAF